MNGIEAGDPGFRVGQGFDVHRTSDDPGRVLVLGGVRFDDVPGLEGHSDADVVAHACTDALLGAAGLGDIGQMFPDTDPALAGADSIELLARATGRGTGGGVAAGERRLRGGARRPEAGPGEARDGGQPLRGGRRPVTVKGRRTEGVGSLGRGEGIVAWAVALVSR